MEQIGILLLVFKLVISSLNISCKCAVIWWIFVDFRKKISLIKIQTHLFQHNNDYSALSPTVAALINIVVFSETFTKALEPVILIAGGENNERKYDRART